MKKIIEWKPDWRLFLYLIYGFIFAVILGTVSHELGHYTVAKMLGLDAKISYGWVSILPAPNERIVTQSEWFLISLGGPLQTMLTGTIGLVLILHLRRSFFRAQQLSFGQWTLVFITFFWSRQPGNFLVDMITSLLAMEMRCSGDDLALSQFLQWPDCAFIAVTATAGYFILNLILFKFIPKAQRLTFILAGVVGGALGIVIWFGWLGKILMP